MASFTLQVEFESRGLSSLTVKSCLLINRCSKKCTWKFFSNFTTVGRPIYKYLMHISASLRRGSLIKFNIFASNLAPETRFADWRAKQAS